MSITATELKMNLSKYLMLAEKEDIYITRNGKVVAKLTNPYADGWTWQSLCLVSLQPISLWKNQKRKG